MNRWFCCAQFVVSAQKVLYVMYKYMYIHVCGLKPLFRQPLSWFLKHSSHLLTVTFSDIPKS